MAVVTLTKENFDREVLQAEMPVLVDFWASWCGSCKAQTPVIKELGAEAQDFKVCSLDVDGEAELAGHCGVMSVPTLLVFQNGKVQKRMVGVQKKSTILEAIEQLKHDS